MSTRERKGSPALRRRPQLSEDVADHVRGLIMSGELRPGGFVRLDETAADLGVSVTPVREALLTLRGEGLVELVPHRGYVVSPLSRDDVRDIFWLQGNIAVELTVRAARKITTAEIDQLDALGNGLRSAVEAQDIERIEHYEFEFHRLINVTAGAAKLAWFLHNAVRYTPHRMYAADKSWGALAVDSHDRLIKAMRSADLDEVACQTRRQFDDGADRLIAHLDRVGMWD